MILPSGQVTFLYTDVEGSARLYQQHPEAMPRALTRHTDILRQAIEAQGGVIFRTTGDGICVAFSDAPAALFAAMEAQQGFSHEPWPVTGPLRVRMGIHTGPAEVAADGYTYSLALVLVQRLMSAAHGGQTLLSAAAVAAMHDHLPPGATLRNLGEQRLRNLVSRDFVYQLMIPGLPADFPPLRLPGGDESQDTVALLLDRLERGRLVGRSAEMEQLEQHRAHAAQGRGHLVLLSGEPGVGKTRLALALMEQARSDGAVVLRGGCYEYEAATPYLPVVEAIREWVHRQSIESLRAALGDNAAELARLAPEIEARLGPLSPNPPLGPAEERLRFFDNVARFFDRIAQQSGLVLFLDDLHWADPGTLALLHYLLRALRESPILLLAAYREIELVRIHPLAASLVTWNRERIATRISLDRLSRPQTRELLSSFFGAQAISTEFVALIYRETEGNPFFVEEVIKTLIEQGQIYREGESWQRKEIAELAVPQSVIEAIGRRLDRLASETAEALSLAAALGKQFTYVELAAVAGMNEDVLLNALDQATAAQLLRPVGDEALVFTHDKIREVLHRELNPMRRRRLHRRIGEALKTLYAGREEAHIADLAYHFAEAGDLELTLDYSLRAAEAASALFAHDAALDHLRQALEAAQQLDRPEIIGDIHARMGRTAYAAGSHVQAAEYFRQALMATSDPAARAALKVRIGDAHAMIGHAEGLPVLEEALRELDPATQTADLALALALIGRHHHFRAQHTEAIAALEQARALAEPLDDPGALLWIYSALSGAYQHLCDFDRSDDWAHTCVTLGERRAFAAAICVGHEMLAENACIRGHWIVAQEHARIDREIGERIGDQDRVAWASYSQALALSGLGRLAEAETEAVAGLALALRIGDQRVACWFEPLLTTLLAEQGRHAEAEDCVVSALARADALGQLTLRLIARNAAIIVFTRRGDATEAAKHAAIFLEGALTSESRMAYIFGGPAVAEALLRAGDTERTADFIEEFLAFTANRAPHPHAVALGVRGRVRAARGEIAEARADLDTAIAALEKLDSRLELTRVVRAREDLLPG